MSKNKMMCADGYGKLHVFRATECCEDEINALKEQIAALKEDVQEAKLDGAVEVEGGVVSKPESNVKMTGNVATTANITAKSVYMDGATVSTKVVVNVSENVEATDVVVNGAFTGSGSVFSINNAEKVVYKGLKFEATDSYNAVEVGLSGDKQVKEVVFEDCVFSGPVRNNAISVFGVQEGTVITIKNCTFEKVSNVVRYSNKTNVSGVVLNIIDCKVTEWAEQPDYAGLVICEDYTSKTAEECVEKSLFAPEKLTINVENSYYNDKNIASLVKEKGVENTVVYVYRDKGNPKSVHVVDNESAYPKVVVK